MVKESLIFKIFFEKSQIHIVVSENFRLKNLLTSSHPFVFYLTQIFLLVNIATRPDFNVNSFVTKKLSETK